MYAGFLQLEMDAFYKGLTKILVIQGWQSVPSSQGLAKGP